ncbi:MAG: hypothetical protein KC731_17515 [Myxococcales bacterium]|nr:hypothetical protein [Myxococcales bacterium]
MSDAARARRDRSRQRRKTERGKKARPADEVPALAEAEAKPARHAGDAPRFTEAYPEDPDLGRLVAAFAAGNFAAVREGAPRLAEKTDDERVKQAALDLRRRIDPSPTSVYLWALGVALLALLYGFYLSHRP